MDKADQTKGGSPLNARILKDHQEYLERAETARYQRWHWAVNFVALPAPDLLEWAQDGLSWIFAAALAMQGLSILWGVGGMTPIGKMASLLVVGIPITFILLSAFQDPVTGRHSAIYRICLILLGVRLGAPL